MIEVKFNIAEIRAVIKGIEETPEKTTFALPIVSRAVIVNVASPSSSVNWLGARMIFASYQL